MLRFAIILFLLGILSSAKVLGQAEQPYEPQKIRIKVSPEAYSTLKYMPARIHSRKGKHVTCGIQSLNKLNEKHKARELNKTFVPQREALVKRHESKGLNLWYTITLDEQVTPELLKEFQDDPYILIAERVYKKKLLSNEIALFDDTRLGEQWHYENIGQTGGTTDADIDLLNAWNIETGDSSVIVAIIDGGIDFNHEDLSQAMWVNKAEFSGTKGVDDDGNGYIDDIYGYNFGDHTGTIVPDEHGTHVAGTVGAISNNSKGVSGIAGGDGSGNGVRLMSCQTFGKTGSDGFAEALVYAADNGAVIAQNSWGYVKKGYYEQAVLDAIDYFIENAGKDDQGNQTGPMNGGIVIFAAGNDFSNGNFYPAYYNPVVAVASTNHFDKKADYSNYGTWVDISAPGGESGSKGILSTLPDNSYGFMQGTSMACPHVSGVAALIISHYGGYGFTPEELKGRLFSCTDNIEDLNPTYHDMLGRGRLNAYQALQTGDSIAPGRITDLSVSDTGVVSVELSWTATGASADSGIAAYYEIRFSTQPIEESNFQDAIKASHIIHPDSSGSNQSNVINGLIPNTSYYFAMIVYDQSGLNSEISNIVTARTHEAPVITVNPGYLYQRTDSGQQISQSITISNTGNSILEFEIPSNSDNISNSPNQFNNQQINKIKDILSNNPIVKSYEKKDDRAEILVNTNYENEGNEISVHDVIYAELSNDLRGLNVLLPSSLDIFALELQLMGAEIHLYSFLNDTNLLDTLDVLITKDYHIPVSFTGAINRWIRNGGNLIIDGDDDLEIYNKICEGSGISVINNAAKGGYTNKILNHVVTDTISQYYIGQSARSSLNISSPATILIHDKTGNIFSAACELEKGKIVVICDETLSNTELNQQTLGINAVRWFDYGTHWMSFDITSGTIPVGGSTDVTITFNADSLSPNTYFENLVILSNDPVHPQKTIPCTLHVNGIPEIAIDTNYLAFLYSYYGYTDSLTLEISNTGTDSLQISDISSNNPVFFVSEENKNISINRNESKKIKIYFSPSILGIDQGTLTITSNDPSNPEVDVTLKAYSIIPPVINVTPDSLHVSLLHGDTTIRTIHISNNSPSGADTLFYQLSAVPSSTATNQNRIIKEGDNIASKYSFIKAHSINNQVITYSLDERINVEGEEINIQDFSKSALTDELSGLVVAAHSTRSIFSFHLDLKGATTHLIPSFTDTALLDTIDVLIADDGFIPSAYSENLNQWIRNGGSLMIDADEDLNIFNAVIEGSGIEFISDPCSNEITDHIFRHSITDSVFEYYIGSSALSSLRVDNPAKELIADSRGNIYAAAAKLGKGKIVMISNESLDNIGINQKELGINAVRWFHSSTDWIDIDPMEGFITSANSVDIDVILNTFDEKIGQHKVDLIISSNDPAVPETRIPVVLEISGVPELQLSEDSIYFNSFVGYESTQRLQIMNPGTDTLFVHNIISTDPEFYTETSPLFILPDHSLSIDVTFAPVEIENINSFLVIESNDSSNLSDTIYLFGKSDIAPVIETDHQEISSQLQSGERDSVRLRITNTGNGASLSYQVFEMEIDTISESPEFKSQSINQKDESLGLNQANIFIQEQTTDNSVKDNYSEDIALNLLLASLTENIDVISDKIPGRFDFEDGMSSYYISDGGNDMYDQGNILSTNLGGNLYYTGNSISSSPHLGYKKYFTYKENGIFIMAADMENVDYLTISGGLGADGKGNVDGSILSIYKNGNSYLGFVKRVYGTTDPSVNHLVITQRESALSHEFSTYSDDDYHKIKGLSSSSRIYYLMFAGKDGVYIDNHEMLNIMSAFIDQVNQGWLSLDKMSGEIPAGDTDSLYITFDANHLISNDYFRNLMIVSNDPVGEITDLPVHLTITGVAHLKHNTDTVKFGETFIGYPHSDSINIVNAGTDTLFIHSVTSTSDEFSVEVSSQYVLPYDSINILVTFDPEVTAKTLSYLIIESNDSSHIYDSIPLLGTGILPPAISTDTDSINITIFSGEEYNQNLTLNNILGNSELTYHISLQNEDQHLKAGTGEDIIFDPETGNILPGNSLTVLIHLDANYLIPGEYYCDTILISSNDPANSLISIPLIINVIECASNIVSLNANICEGDSYEIGDTSFTESGNYFIFMTNSHGCDSVINLDLTVNEAKTTVIYDTISQGESVQIGNYIFTEAGLYNITLKNENDCDSLVSIDLQVIQEPNSVNNAGLEAVTVYPNPTSGKLYIDMSKFTNEVYYQVILTDGTVILNGVSNPILSENNMIDLSELQNGIVLVKLISENQSIVKRIIVKK